jgi:hypothetical protein
VNIQTTMRGQGFGKQKLTTLKVLTCALSLFALCRTEHTTQSWEESARALALYEYSFSRETRVECSHRAYTKVALRFVLVALLLVALVLPSVASFPTSVPYPCISLKMRRSSRVAHLSDTSSGKDYVRICAIRESLTLTACIIVRQLRQRQAICS